MTQDELLEKLAELEHEQWMQWALAVGDEVDPERLAKWRKYLVPYKHLSEEIKEKDRAFARKVLGVIMQYQYPIQDLKNRSASRDMGFDKKI